MPTLNVSRRPIRGEDRGFIAAVVLPVHQSALEHLIRRFVCGSIKAFVLLGFRPVRSRLIRGLSHGSIAARRALGLLPVTLSPIRGVTRGFIAASSLDACRLQLRWCHPWGCLRLHCNLFFQRHSHVCRYVPSVGSLTAPLQHFKMTLTAGAVAIPSARGLAAPLQRPSNLVYLDAQDNSSMALPMAP